MVNDCSPYTNCEYQDLIEEFKNQINIRYFKTTINSGPGIARQLGLDNATADWIMFIDDDDELYNNTSLERLLNLARNDVVAVSGQSLQTTLEYIHDFKTEIHEPWLHHQGSIYNRKLLVKHNIHFDSRISYREEDGAFSSSILFGLPQYEHLLLHELVYKKKFSLSYTSLTSKPFDASNVINLIGLKSIEINCIMTSHSKYSTDEQLFVIANLLDFFTNQATYTMTRIQYNNLKSFIDDIEPYTIRMKMDILKNDCKYFIEFYNNIFSPDFGTFTYDSINKYLDHRYEWLEQLKKRIIE